MEDTRNTQEVLRIWLLDLSCCTLAHSFGFFGLNRLIGMQVSRGIAHICGPAVWTDDNVSKSRASRLHEIRRDVY